MDCAHLALSYEMRCPCTSPLRGLMPYLFNQLLCMCNATTNPLKMNNSKKKPSLTTIHHIVKLYMHEYPMSSSIPRTASPAPCDSGVAHHHSKPMSIPTTSPTSGGGPSALSLSLSSTAPDSSGWASLLASAGALSPPPTSAAGSSFKDGAGSLSYSLSRGNGSRSPLMPMVPSPPSTPATATAAAAEPSSMTAPPLSPMSGSSPGSISALAAAAARFRSAGPDGANGGNGSSAIPSSAPSSGFYSAAAAHARRSSAPGPGLPGTGTSPPGGANGSLLSALAAAAGYRSSSLMSAPTSPDVMLTSPSNNSGGDGGGAPAVRRRVQSLSSAMSLTGWMTAGPLTAAAVASSGGLPAATAPIGTGGPPLRASSIAELEEPVAASPTLGPMAPRVTRARSMGSAHPSPATAAAAAARRAPKRRPSSPMREFILSGRALDAL
ncbi:hypothetical protein BC828DRAFT_1164 [Blastocladiella britannica]|nr:hypothetical protein BC828DRAFT_1164 [Blastocladiella britannica]